MVLVVVFFLMIVLFGFVFIGVGLEFMIFFCSLGLVILFGGLMLLDVMIVVIVWGVWMLLLFGMLLVIWKSFRRL